MVVGDSRLMDDFLKLDDFPSFPSSIKCKLRRVGFGWVPSLNETLAASILGTLVIKS